MAIRLISGHLRYIQNEIPLARITRYFAFAWTARMLVVQFESNQSISQEWKQKIRNHRPSCWWWIHTRNMHARSEMRLAIESSHRWSLMTYEDEKPLQRLPVQHCVYEPSFDDRSLQFCRHERLIENEFLLLFSYFFCTHKSLTDKCAILCQ